MKIHGSVETRSAARQALKPTAVISAPTRFSGRRSQTRMPVPMNAQPVSGPKTAISQRWWPPSFASASASGTAPAMKPTAARAIKARRNPLIAGSIVALLRAAAAHR